MNPLAFLPSNGSAPSAGLLAVFVGMMIVAGLMALAAHIYMGVCTYLIAQKTNTKHPWLAFLPVGNLWLMRKVSGCSGWYFWLALLGLILSFVPTIGWFALAAAVVCIVIIWMGIAEVRGQESWIVLLILIPVAGFAIPAVLAAGPPSPKA